MKSGTNHAVLVRDLFSGSGPHEELADDFVARRCSGCRGSVDETRFYQDHYLCEQCWSLVVPS